MGCGLSVEEKENRKVSKKIDQELKQHQKLWESEVKFLLLGTGESGKSTFFKQMKILAENSQISNEDLMAFVPIIQNNCVSEIKVLIRAMENLGFEPDSSSQPSIEFLKNTGDVPAFSGELVGHIKTVWADKSIKETYQRRGITFAISDSAEYFFEHIDKYLEANYTPTQQDMLRCRVRTTGIEEAEFVFDSLKFRMVDVGGQRSERKKWIHCLDCVTAVLYFVALSEYDQGLREDPTINRMQESLTLFDGICNSPWFWNTTFVIFFNKRDIFQEKIETVDLKKCFPDYTGSNDWEQAANFIRDKFTEKNEAPHPIYSHYTVAIDTENIHHVFKAAKDTIMRGLLNDVL